MSNPVSVKEAVVNKLADKGFYINRVCEDGEVFMSKKVRFSTFYAEVSEDGSINGNHTVASFLSSIKR